MIFALLHILRDPAAVAASVRNGEIYLAPTDAIPPQRLIGTSR